MGKTSRATDWIEALPTEGRYTFSRAEALAATDASRVALKNNLRRLKESGRLVSPRRGFYVHVPPEYRTAGSPPASWFIDDLMRHLGRRYYVGLLSAAAIHGSAHQQPMVFQVIADAPVRDMRAGRVTIEMHRSDLVGKAATIDVQTETGTMFVSSPETTAFDLVRFPESVGYWNNVATVIGELAEQLSADRLVQAAGRTKLPDAQRLGFLLQLLEEEHLAEALAGWLARRRPSVVRLRPDRPAGEARVDARWRLIPNDDVEPDA